MTASSPQNAGGPLPTGTVTFLFTDIEGSTRLAQRTSADEFQALIETHNTLVDRAIVADRGIVIRTEGDSFFAVFASAPAALSAAVAAQRALTDHVWPNDEKIRVRMGIHTGEGRLGGADYIGFDVHRAARISAAAHGGQVVVSADTAALARHSLPSETTLIDLGRHRLKDLATPEHLHQVTIDALPAEFPPLRTSPVSPHKLPARLTSFVGRTSEVSEAAATIRAQRLVTLTGPGGTGKTRLAEEVAIRVADEFDGGAFFIPLADLRDPELLAPTILEALDVPWSRDSDPAPQLIRHLEGKRVLLVLDNFEQLLDATPILAGMLAASPQLSVIATSRSPLRISGEHEYPVAPLPTPPPEATGAELLANESVTLFIDRARSVDPAFEWTDRTAAAVASIANRLDGLPLGIELVAARVKAMPPEIAADRLEGRLVAGGAATSPSASAPWPTPSPGVTTCSICPSNDSSRTSASSSAEPPSTRLKPSTASSTRLKSGICSRPSLTRASSSDATPTASRTSGCWCWSPKTPPAAWHNVRTGP
jgi:class 3 adenylate cyclase